MLPEMKFLPAVQPGRKTSVLQPGFGSRAVPQARVPEGRRCRQNERVRENIGEHFFEFLSGWMSGWLQFIGLQFDCRSLSDEIQPEQHRRHPIALFHPPFQSP